MKFAFFVLFTLLSITPALCDTLEGRVVGVHDGDTITLLSTDKVTTKVRLAQIDAPELAQPFGQSAKQALSALVFGKSITVKTEVKDRYGRTVGTLFLGDEDINAQMVATGNAWYYRQYGHDPKLQALQDSAKARKLGLWALQNDQIQAPWTYRHSVKTGTPPAANDNATGYSCSGKSKCGQMSSCAEARFYLTQCGMSQLDGNHDGTPCESLCK